MKYNKLVRDRIPEIIKRQGGKAIVHVASRKEYWQKLKKKLVEETIEFVEKESPEEISDILEVVDAICVFKGFDKRELWKVQRRRAKERGVFKKRIILEES
ncbi:MAG: hypothetical protein LiPW39_47 [Parcubacteria group bacterium LiPW_39]|nr:MAG: hypothetical protein LiPW39_47 [Parcubacteria group bacterium LiPW_39]